MEKDPPDSRVTVLMEPAFLDQIEEFQFAHRVRNRSDAILALLKVGLAHPEQSAKQIEKKRK